MQIKALFAYSDSKGLSFVPGDVLEVLQKVDSNWLQVRTTHAEPKGEGLAPANYVEALPDEPAPAHEPAPEPVPVATAAPVAAAVAAVVVETVKTEQVRVCVCACARANE